MPPPPPPTQTQRARATFAQPKQQKRGGSGSKQQQRQHVLPPTVSPEVTALRKLISHIEKPPSKSASQGCFCQSRTHPLSPYTPQCMSCGLVLCSLNPPFHPCPFAACSAPLLADHAKRALVDQLSAQVAQTIADEEDTRRREDEARVRAAGAFPELGAAGGSSNNNGTLSSASTGMSTGRQQSRGVVAAAAGAKASYYTTQMREPQQQQIHKVISLSGKGKVTATYTRLSPSPSSASLHAKAEEQDTVRVPPPPEGPEYVKLDPADFNSKRRLYEDLRGEGPVYIPLPSEENARSDAREGSGRRRRPHNNKRKKNQGKENEPQVPEAGPSGHS